MDFLEKRAGVERRWYTWTPSFIRNFVQSQGPLCTHSPSFLSGFTKFGYGSGGGHSTPIPLPIKSDPIIFERGLSALPPPLPQAASAGKFSEIVYGLSNDMVWSAAKWQGEEPKLKISVFMLKKKTFYTHESDPSSLPLVSLSPPEHFTTSAATMQSSPLLFSPNSGGIHSLAFEKSPNQILESILSAEGVAAALRLCEWNEWDVGKLKIGAVRMGLRNQDSDMLQDALTQIFNENLSDPKISESDSLNGLFIRAASVGAAACYVQDRRWLPVNDFSLRFLENAALIGSQFSNQLILSLPPSQATSTKKQQAPLPSLPTLLSSIDQHIVAQSGVQNFAPPEIGLYEVLGVVEHSLSVFRSFLASRIITAVLPHVSQDRSAAPHNVQHMLEREAGLLSDLEGENGGIDQGQLLDTENGKEDSENFDWILASLEEDEETEPETPSQLSPTHTTIPLSLPSLLTSPLPSLTRAAHQTTLSRIHSHEAVSIGSGRSKITFAPEPFVSLLDEWENLSVRDVAIESAVKGIVSTALAYLEHRALRDGEESPNITFKELKAIAFEAVFEYAHSDQMDKARAMIRNLGESTTSNMKAIAFLTSNPSVRSTLLSRFSGGGEHHEAETTAIHFLEVLGGLFRSAERPMATTWHRIEQSPFLPSVVDALSWPEITRHRMLLDFVSDPSELAISVSPLARLAHAVSKHSISGIVEWLKVLPSALKTQAKALCDDLAELSVVTEPLSGDTQKQQQETSGGSIQVTHGEVQQAVSKLLSFCSPFISSFLIDSLYSAGFPLSDGADTFPLLSRRLATSSLLLGSWNALVDPLTGADRPGSSRLTSLSDMLPTDGTFSPFHSLFAQWCVSRDLPTVLVAYFDKYNLWQKASSTHLDLSARHWLIPLIRSRTDPNSFETALALTQLSLKAVAPDAPSTLGLLFTSKPLAAFAALMFAQKPIQDVLGSLSIDFSSLASASRPFKSLSLFLHHNTTKTKFCKTEKRKIAKTQTRKVCEISIGSKGLLPDLAMDHARGGESGIGIDGEIGKQLISEVALNAEGMGWVHVERIDIEQFITQGRAIAAFHHYCIERVGADDPTKAESAEQMVASLLEASYASDEEPCDSPLSPSVHIPIEERRSLFTRVLRLVLTRPGDDSTCASAAEFLELCGIDSAPMRSARECTLRILTHCSEFTADKDMFEKTQSISHTSPFYTLIITPMLSLTPVDLTQQTLIPAPVPTLSDALQLLVSYLESATSRLEQTRPRGGGGGGPAKILAQSDLWSPVSSFCRLFYGFPKFSRHLQAMASAGDWVQLLWTAQQEGWTARELIPIVMTYFKDKHVQEHLFIALRSLAEKEESPSGGLDPELPTFSSLLTNHPESTILENLWDAERKGDSQLLDKNVPLSSVLAFCLDPVLNSPLKCLLSWVRAFPAGSAATPEQTTKETAQSLDYSDPMLLSLVSSTILSSCPLSCELDLLRNFAKFLGEGLRIFDPTTPLLFFWAFVVLFLSERYAEASAELQKFVSVAESIPPAGSIGAPMVGDKQWILKLAEDFSIRILKSVKTHFERTVLLRILSTHSFSHTLSTLHSLNSVLSRYDRDIQTKKNLKIINSQNPAEPVPTSPEREIMFSSLDFSNFSVDHLINSLVGSGGFSCAAEVARLFGVACDQIPFLEAERILKRERSMTLWNLPEHRASVFARLDRVFKPKVENPNFNISTSSSAAASAVQCLPNADRVGAFFLDLANSCQSEGESSASSRTDELRLLNLAIEWFSGSNGRAKRPTRPTSFIKDLQNRANFLTTLTTTLPNPKPQKTLTPPEMALLLDKIAGEGGFEHATALCQEWGVQSVVISLLRIALDLASGKTRSPVELSGEDKRVVEKAVFYKETTSGSPSRPHPLSFYHSISSDTFIPPPTSSTDETRPSTPLQPTPVQQDFTLTTTQSLLDTICNFICSAPPSILFSTPASGVSWETCKNLAKRIILFYRISLIVELPYLEVATGSPYNVIILLLNCGIDFFKTCQSYIAARVAHVPTLAPFATHPSIPTGSGGSSTEDKGRENQQETSPPEELKENFQGRLCATLSEFLFTSFQKEANEQMAPTESPSIDDRLDSRSVTPADYSRMTPLNYAASGGKSTKVFSSFESMEDEGDLTAKFKPTKWRREDVVEFAALCDDPCAVAWGLLSLIRTAITRDVHPMAALQLSDSHHSSFSGGIYGPAHFSSAPSSSITSLGLPKSCEVELLIRTYWIFAANSHVHGVDATLALTQERVDKYIESQSFKLLVRLLAGMQDFAALGYLFDVITDHDHFELFLSKSMVIASDKRGVTRASSALTHALADFVKRRFPGDHEKLIMVYARFRMYKEHGQLLFQMVQDRLRGMSRLPVRDLNPRATPTAELSSGVGGSGMGVGGGSGPAMSVVKYAQELIQCSLELKTAADFFRRVDQHQTAHKCFVQAALCELARDLSEIHCGMSAPNGLTAAHLNSYMAVPVTHMTKEQAREFITEHKVFSESLVVAEAYEINHLSEWVQPLFRHAVCANNVTYFLDYKSVLPAPASLFKEIAKIYSRTSEAQQLQLAPKIKELLSLCEDVSAQFDIAKSLRFDDLLIASAKALDDYSVIYQPWAPPTPQ